MLSKIKTLLSYLFPYEISSEEKEFTQLNNGAWLNNGRTLASKQNTVIVEGHVDCPASIIDKARIAKAIEEETGRTALVYVRGFYFRGSNVAHVYQSFGIKGFYFWWRNYLNPLVIVPVFYQSLKVFLFSNTGDKLIALNYKGVVIGDLIYDTLIRFIPNTYTIDKLSLKKHFRLIFRAFYTFHNNEKIIRKYKPKYLVTSHNVYAEFGLFPRQLRKSNNGVIFLKDIYAYKCYSQDISINEHFLKVDRNYFDEKLNDPEYELAARDYYNARTSGNISHIDVINAYRNKKKYTFDELSHLYSGVNPSGKNVFVMSHAFSDSPHVGEGILFRDYYDFLQQTLIILNEVKGINCFVKPHPSSYMWNEKGGVEALVENNKLKNIYILPADFNTNSIIDIADSIVTAKGTAGLEFSCAGIPAVTAGKGYYHGSGITCEPETVEEYFTALKSLPDIIPLDEEKIKRALVMLYMVSKNRQHSEILPESHIFPGEDYHALFRGKFAEVSKKLADGVPMKDSFYERVKSDAERTDV